ncbi:DNA-directed RNA polymerase subunit omega [Porphyromonadaceae bacterium W3.11]|nr:DNA-directed RNA polymerase subunit omega [Porphyromonadaceae bacterium W3.11]
MERKKGIVPQTTVTRDLKKFSEPTGNLYESVVIMSKRANQLSVDIKEDLEQKLQEFSTYTDTLEEVVENHEQIEISKYYEKMPKPVLIAAKEFEEEEIYYRNPLEEITDEDDDF